MDALHQQQLISAINNLRTTSQEARDRLRTVQELPDDQSDGPYLGPIRADMTQLRRGVEEVEAKLQSCRDYIHRLPADQQPDQFNTLAALPTYWDELDNRDDQDQRWPIYKLIDRAKLYANKAEGLLLSRDEELRVSHSRSQSMHSIQQSIHSQQQSAHASAASSRPPTPIDTAQLFENLRIDKTFTIQDAKTNANTFANQNNQQQLGANSRRPANFGQPHNTTGQRTAHHQQSSETFSCLRPVRIDPPKFGGKIREWPTFWAAFEMAVHSQPYPDFEKHLFLLQYLEKGSPARSAIENYPPSNENYPIVLRILRKKYGDEDALQDQLHAELLHLPSVNKVNWRDLHNLHQEVDRICIQLGRLQPGTDAIICNLIRSKLPVDIVVELHKMEKQSRTKWNANDLRDGLEAIVTDREQAERFLATYHAKEQPKEEKQSTNDRRRDGHRDRHRNDQRDSNNAILESRNFHSANTNTDLHCSLCDKDGHKPSKCSTYQTAKQRRDRLFEQRRCLICLRQNHVTKDCPDPNRKCDYCSLTGHHVLICYKKENDSKASQNSTHQNNNNDKKPPKPTGGNAQPLNSSQQTSGLFSSTTLLTSAQLITDTHNQHQANDELLVDVVNPQPPPKQKAMLMSRGVTVSSPDDPNYSVNCTILLDSGSETSYISSDLVRQLMPPQLRNERLRVHTFGKNPPQIINSPVYAILLQCMDLGWKELDLNMIEEIASPLSTQQWDRDSPTLDSSSDVLCISAKPDILIGIRHFWDLVIDRSPLPKEPGLHIIQTVFGPVFGGTADFPPAPTDTSTLSSIVELDESVPMPEADPPPHPTDTNTLVSIQAQDDSLPMPNAIEASPDELPPNPLDLMTPSTETAPILIPLSSESTQPEPGAPELEPPCIEQGTMKHTPPPTEPSYPTPKKRRKSPEQPAKSRQQLSAHHQGRWHIPKFLLLFTALATLLSPTTPFGIIFPLFDIWPFNGAWLHHDAKLLNITSVSCPGCNLTCTSHGVIATGPPETQKLEICCLQACLSRPSTTSLTFNLPLDSLLIDYDCQAWFWMNSSHVSTSKLRCPATDSCELFDCWFCYTQLQNPTCNPQWASFLYIVISGTCFAALGCLISCLRSVRISIFFIYNLGAYILSGPLRLAFWIAGRPWTRNDQEEVARRLRQGTNRLARNIKSRVRRVRGTTRRYLGIAAIFMTLSAVQSSSETISFTTSSESCRRGTTGLHCSISTATTLTLLPAGQLNTLLVRDEHGMVLATLSFRLNALTIVCHPKTEAWLRSFTIDTLAVKRCPRAGSCFNDHCALIRPNSTVPELKHAQLTPGNTFCLESTSFWGNDCGLPSAACLYYRNYIQPTSNQPFELFSCPGWSTQIITELTLEANGGQRQTKKINLHPGLPAHWGNLTITALAVSLPPMPILRSKFITNGQSIALADNVPLDLHCSSEQEARQLNCTLALTACTDCFPDHKAGTVDCNCRNTDLDSLLENPQARLPIDIAKLHLRNQGPSLYALHNYSPVQLHLQMHNLSLIVEFRDSKCWVTPTSFSGCYRCSTGAQFNFKCQSDHASPLAKVECTDGTLFVAHCSINGTDNTVILPFNHYEVNTKCTVECAAGETQFLLNGTLHYIPIKQQFGHHQHTSDRLTPDPENSSPFDFFSLDNLPIVWLYHHWPILLAALIIGLIAFYLFIRFSPALLAYRTMVRLMVILAFIHHSSALSAPFDQSPTDNNSAGRPKNYLQAHFDQPDLFLFTVLCLTAIAGAFICRHLQRPLVGLPFIIMLLAFTQTRAAGSPPPFVRGKGGSQPAAQQPTISTGQLGPASRQPTPLLLFTVNNHFSHQPDQQCTLPHHPTLMEPFGNNGFPPRSTNSNRPTQQAPAEEFANGGFNPHNYPPARPSRPTARVRPHQQPSSNFTPIGTRSPGGFGTPRARSTMNIRQQFSTLPLSQRFATPPVAPAPSTSRPPGVRQPTSRPPTGCPATLFTRRPPGPCPGGTDCRFCAAQFGTQQQSQQPSSSSAAADTEWGTNNGGWDSNEQSNQQQQDQPTSSSAAPLDWGNTEAGWEATVEETPIQPSQPYPRQPRPIRRRSAGEPLHQFLFRILGENWPEENHQLADQLLTLHWNNIHRESGRPLGDNPHLTIGNANAVLVTPSTTVAQHWRREGEPLQHPHLPLITVTRGVRGTSRESRRRQNSGHCVWRLNEAHEDHIPLERLTIAIPPITPQPHQHVHFAQYPVSRGRLQSPPPRNQPPPTPSSTQTGRGQPSKTAHTKATRAQASTASASSSAIQSTHALFSSNSPSGFAPSIAQHCPAGTGGSQQPTRPPPLMGMVIPFPAPPTKPTAQPTTKKTTSAAAAQGCKSAGTDHSDPPPPPPGGASAPGSQSTPAETDHSDSPPPPPGEASAPGPQSTDSPASSSGQVANPAANSTHTPSSVFNLFDHMPPDGPANSREIRVIFTAGHWHTCTPAPPALYLRPLAHLHPSAHFGQISTSATDHLANFPEIFSPTHLPTFHLNLFHSLFSILISCPPESFIHNFQSLSLRERILPAIDMSRASLSPARSDELDYDPEEVNNARTAASSSANASEKNPATAKLNGLVFRKPLNSKVVVPPASGQQPKQPIKSVVIPTATHEQQRQRQSIVDRVSFDDNRRSLSRHSSRSRRRSRETVKHKRARHQEPAPSWWLPATPALYPGHRLPARQPSPPSLQQQPTTSATAQPDIAAILQQLLPSIISNLSQPAQPSTVLQKLQQSAFPTATDSAAQSLQALSLATGVAGRIPGTSTEVVAWLKTVYSALLCCAHHVDMLRQIMQAEIDKSAAAGGGTVAEKGSSAKGI